MVDYPVPKKKPSKRKNAAAKKRGMALEKLVDEANRFYLEHDKAVIHKKPTPIQTVRVDYPAREKAKITEAYYRKPSTTDYNGIYRGHYIDFDVKETNHKTSYALKNIHDHQIEHLRRVQKHGGLAFILIHVKREDAFFLLPFEKLERYLARAKKGRKSMTFAEIAAEGFAIDEGYRPRLDYLKAVEAYLEKN